MAARYEHDAAVAAKQFDEMLSDNIPGQNWNCTLISCYGDGMSAMKRYGEPARCVLYAKDGKGLPTLRARHSTPITQGMIVWVPDQQRHYLLTDMPQLAPDCISTTATPCTKEITVQRHYNAPVSGDGYVLGKEYDATIVADYPCAVHHLLSMEDSTGHAGLIVADRLEILTQLNKCSAAIKMQDFFVLDGSTYRITDIATEGTASTVKDPDNMCGLLKLTCQRMAGTTTT